MIDQKQYILSRKLVDRFGFDTVSPRKSMLLPVLATLVLVLTGRVPDLRAAPEPVVIGSVTDDAGNPVSDASVLINYAAASDLPKLTAPPVVTGRLVTRVATDSQGSFAIPVLPAGQYVACAEVAVPGLLDPCHWATSAPTFTVAAEQPTASIKIVMTRGAVLPIHVADPLALLSNSITGPIDFAFQVHVVTGKGLHYNAPIQAHSAAGRDYAATVPYGTPVSIRILTAKAAVADQAGNALPIGGSPVTVAAGATAAPITFTVTGPSAVSVSPNPGAGGSIGSMVSGAVKR